MRYRNQPLGAITVSIGLACLPENGTAPAALIAAADQALYAAKTAGRNCTRRASALVRATNV